MISYVFDICNNFWFYFFSVDRALNLCRIFTEMGESYLHVMVESPGKVNDHMLFLCLLIINSHVLHFVFSWSYREIELSSLFDYCLSVNDYLMKEVTKYIVKILFMHFVQSLESLHPHKHVFMHLLNAE